MDQAFGRGRPIQAHRDVFGCCFVDRGERDGRSDARASSRGREDLDGVLLRWHGRLLSHSRTMDANLVSLRVCLYIRRMVEGQLARLVRQRSNLLLAARRPARSHVASSNGHANFRSDFQRSSVRSSRYSHSSP